MFKPMLAEDAVLKKIKFPCVVQPKIDGVRALNVDGLIKPRSLKEFNNKAVKRMFSLPAFGWMDGEMIVGDDPTAPDLCRLTTSALNTIEGVPNFHWWLFDHPQPNYRALPYQQRRSIMAGAIGFLGSNVHLIPQDYARDMEELTEHVEEHLRQGYEGTIVRDPTGYYKCGRSTANEGLLLRIKQFEMDDAIVVGFTEEMHNGNEATKNALGNTERSTHASGYTGKGSIGTLLCKKVVNGAATDEEIKVGPGRMTADEKVWWFNDPAAIVGKKIRYKHFPKGVKDKPRFPTFEWVY